MKKNIVYFILIILLCSCSKPVFDYRSISFHVEPDSQTILLAAKLGFNNVCLQTEGDTYKRLLAIRETENEKGYFRLAKQQGMTVSLWVHELNNYNDAWGSVSLDNTFLWDTLQKRYKYYLNELFPEIDYLVLTVVETQINISDEAIFLKMVNTIYEECKKSNKKLIIRSFTHFPSELEIMTNVLGELPKDIIIETKMVPSDWNMRGSENPLIAKLNSRQQFIELDIAGEYFRGEYIPNYFSSILKKHFDYWKQNHCSGITVRVDRAPRNVWWEPLKFTHRVTGQIQEANLWMLGYLASGKSDNPNKALKDFCVHHYGKKAASAMADAIRPTGEILAEALSVESLPFGVTRNSVPAEWTMNGLHCECHDTIAIAYPDSLDKLYRNPFNLKYSPWIWVDSLQNEYQLIRRGHPSVIERKTIAYHKNLNDINRSIELIQSVKKELTPIQYEYLTFKFEESKYHLTAMCEAQLAWLKASHQLYFPNDDSIRYAHEVNEHLNNIIELENEPKSSFIGEWNHRHYHLTRGEYLDLPAFIKLFTKYWRVKQ